MLRKTVLLSTLVALSIGTATFAITSTASKNKGLSESSVAAILNCPVGQLETTLHDLWDDHVYYTREFIISDLTDLPDKSAVADRLMRNQKDIGDAMGQYYGKSAGDGLTKLLDDHITLAVQVVDAAKAHDTNAFNDANTKWRQNAHDIAMYLSKANPYFDQKVLESDLDKHLDLTILEVQDRLSNDWTKDITDADAGVAHMRGFADYLAAATIKKFPNKFKPTYRPASISHPAEANMEPAT